MYKKFFAAILSVLFLLNMVYTSGLVESDSKKLEQEKLNQEQSSRYGLYATLGVGAILAVPFVVGLLSGSDSAENSMDDGEAPVNDGWAYVSNCYFKAAEAEKQKRGVTAEYYEHMADSYRCRLYLDSNRDAQRYSYYKNAFSNFEQASSKYLERAKLHSNDVKSYKYQINSAKAAEIRAKSEELMILARMELYDTRPGVCTRIDPRPQIAAAWGAVIGKKPSYGAYAKAKQLEYSSKDLSEIAAAWEAVKHDEHLKESFSEDSWEAYEAFAEANRQEWLLKAGQSSKEQLHHAWMQAYEKDEICAKKLNSLVYRAFAAEARQRAQDALKG